VKQKKLPKWGAVEKRLRTTVLVDLQQFLTTLASMQLI